MQPLVLIGLVLLVAVMWVAVIMGMLVGLDRANRTNRPMTQGEHPGAVTGLEGDSDQETQP